MKFCDINVSIKPLSGGAGQGRMGGMGRIQRLRGAAASVEFVQIWRKARRSGYHVELISDVSP